MYDCVSNDNTRFCLLGGDDQCLVWHCCLFSLLSSSRLERRPLRHVSFVEKRLLLHVLFVEGKFFPHVSFVKGIVSWTESLLVEGKDARLRSPAGLLNLQTGILSKVMVQVST